jgi:TolA-binding protein
MTCRNGHVLLQTLPAWFLIVFSGTIGAQQADPCSGLTESALAQCRGNQQRLQQQQLELLQQQIQQQQERQKQLDEQQRQIQQQLEGMRLQNEALRQQLKQENSASQAAPSQPAPSRPAPSIAAPSQPAPLQAADNSKASDLKSWKSDNPWYGSDYAKTEFAMRYAKELQHERPDLVGRPFLDALSAKVRDTFGSL